MKFRYFYNKDREKYRFIKAPQVFFKDKIFASLSSNAKILDELDDKKGIGLIQCKQLGLGKPNIIYVKDFLNNA